MGELATQWLLLLLDNKTVSRILTVNILQALPLFHQYQPRLLEHGGKMTILLDLIKDSVTLGDRILVFRLPEYQFCDLLVILPYSKLILIFFIVSQSLVTLSLIEYFLSKIDVPHLSADGKSQKWTKNESYFRKYHMDNLKFKINT